MTDFDAASLEETIRKIERLSCADIRRRTLLAKKPTKILLRQSDLAEANLTADDVREIIRRSYDQKTEGEEMTDTVPYATRHVAKYLLDLTWVEMEGLLDALGSVTSTGMRGDLASTLVMWATGVKALTDAEDEAERAARDAARRG